MPAEIKSKNQFIPRVNFVLNAVFLNINDEEAKDISQYPEVKRVYPNFKVEATLNDSIPMINADDVWGLDMLGKQCSVTKRPCLTGKGIIIGIIDTGVDYSHTDLGGCFGKNCKVIGGYDFVNKDNDPMDDNGHGTHVAAIAAGNGRLKGVASDALIYAYKVLDGYGGGYAFSVIEALERSIDPNQDGSWSDKIDVVNISLGGKGNPDDPLSLAVDNASRNGIVVVVAAGNNGPDEGTILSPGTAREGITVGAIDKSGNIAYFSSRGLVEFNDRDGNKRFLIKPDIVVPGVDICAAKADKTVSWFGGRTCLDDKHISLSGTSMATPHVAGVAALLKQKYRPWTPYQIKLFLRSGAREIINVRVEDQGYGSLDALGAVKLTIGSPLIAKIDSVVWQGRRNVINIIGSAHGSLPFFRRDRDFLFFGGRDFSFTGYEVYYGVGINPRSWVKIKESYYPVLNGSLALLNIDNENIDGKVSLKLRAYDRYGNYVEDKSIILIDNFNIVSIRNLNSDSNLRFINANSDVVIEVKIAPYLSAVKFFRVDLLSERAGFRKEICRQSAPSGRMPSGKCTVNVSFWRELENDNYQLRLLVSRDGVKWVEDPDVFEFILIKELVDGWPIEIPKGHILANNIVDVFKDESLELPYPHTTSTRTSYVTKLVVPISEECYGSSCVGTKMLVIDHQRKVTTFSTLSDGSVIEDYNKPLVVFDRNLKNNFLFLLNPAFPYYLGNKKSHQSLAKIIDTKGNIIYQWDNTLFKNKNNFYIEENNSIWAKYDYMGVLFDTNDDGFLEVYSIRQVTDNFDGIGAEKNLYIAGWSLNGQLLPNFPIKITKEIPTPYIFYGASPILFLKDKTANSYNIGLMVLESEVDGSKRRLYFDVYSLTGKLLKRIHLLKTPEDGNKLVSFVNSQFAVTDFDGDGNSEAVISYNILDDDLYSKGLISHPDVYQSNLFVISNRGEILASTTLKRFYLRNVVLSKFTDKPNIIALFNKTFASYSDYDKIIVFDKNFKTLYNKSLVFEDYYLAEGMAIGDVDGDSEQEIIINFAKPVYDSRIYSYRNDGFGILIYGPNLGFEKKIMIPVFSDYQNNNYDALGQSPILFDFNRDGYLDIVLSSFHYTLPYLEKSKMRLYLITLFKRVDSRYLDWPTYLHNNQNTLILK